MKILGIDPGSVITGFGLIEVDKPKIQPITYGEISTSKNLDFPRRLKHIYSKICGIIAKNRPDVVAIENIFLSKNFKTAVKIGEAKGIAILAAANHEIDVVEYAPRRIKESITGYGQAGKPQVQKMIVNLLGLSQPPDENASDALAVAICHYHSLQSVSSLICDDKLFRGKTG
ncbi:MAG: crossover junction endodeoxyribonuclease RuvC [Candidatus Omnitrophota bacterium]|nr:crossover junction endodeoxyribonuclease RuvC [Candidatus Omnitrophota bacterium]